MALSFLSRIGSLVRLLTLAGLSALAAGCGGGSSPPKPPSIGVTSFSTDEHQFLTASLQLTDPQGQSLTASVTAQPSHGTLTAPNGTGNFTYQPAHLFHGTDTFTVSVTNTGNVSTTATVTITVREVNLQPTIQTASFSVDEDQALSGDPVLKDPQGEPLTVTVTTPPAHGTLTGPDGTGKFTYTPASHYYGTDSFAVSVADTDALATTATIALTIRRVDYQPVAFADSARTPPAVPVIVNVLTNDTETNAADPLKAVIVSQAANGTATLNADNSITFVPATGFMGTTSLTYAAVDASNTTNAQSAPATLTIDVHPLQKVVYLTSSGPNQQVIYNDTNRSAVVSLPIAPNSTTTMQVSPNGRTVVYNVRPPSGPQAWVAADLRKSPITPVDTGLSTLGSGPLVLSESGLQALIPVNGLAGYLISTEVFLYDVLGGGLGGKVNTGDFFSEQVNDYFFSNNDQTIIYMSHAPTNWSSRSVVFMTRPGGPVQMSPTVAVSEISSMKTPADASRVAYIASRNSATSGVYGVDPQNPGVEVLLAPIVTYFGTGPGIAGFDVAAQGHFAAVTESGGFGSASSATAYLSSLDQLGSYVQIGSTFPVGTRLSAPVFSPDGKRVLMTALTSGGTALYETTTAHPENIVRMSPFYPIDRVISVFKYTQDSTAIVYIADSRSQGVFDIFLVQTSQPEAAALLNAPGSQSVFASSFWLSPDATTIAFAQPEVPGGPLALQLVDRSTPGSPYKVGSDVAPLNFAPPPFVIVP